jgi:hypothetical protein
LNFEFFGKMLRELFLRKQPRPRGYQTFDTLLLTAKPPKRNKFLKKTPIPTLCSGGL